MVRSVATAATILAFTGIALEAQQTARPMSPEGSAQTQVLGKWTKGERPSFSLGRENYVGGKWIEITYGRPLQRQRDLFGSGPNYGKAINDVGTANLPAPPVWRAGANVSTRLRNQMPLEVGGKRVPAGELVMLIDLKSDKNWTLILTKQSYVTNFDPANTKDLYGGFNYRPDNDVARAPMTVERLPYSVDQLMWWFTDVTPAGGTMRIAWERMTASVPFKILQ